MNSTIFYVSQHHGNTLQVAKVINEVLKGDLVDLQKTNLSQNMLDGYDIIGLGSGVYQFSLSQKLYRLVDSVDFTNRKVFLFGTSASGVDIWFKKLRSQLLLQQAHILGEFMCPGFIDWGFFKWFGGGLREGQPNAQDLDDARKFAQGLLKK